VLDLQRKQFRTDRAIQYPVYKSEITSHLITCFRFLLFIKGKHRHRSKNKHKKKSKTKDSEDGVTESSEKKHKSKKKSRQKNGKTREKAEGTGADYESF
jgi:hypothetical protein